jgi:hypothetical protein
MLDFIMSLVFFVLLSFGSNSTLDDFYNVELLVIKISKLTTELDVLL